MPVIHAVNAVTNNHFSVVNPECSVEYLQTLLQHLSLLPQYLTCHEEVGTCVLCQQQYRQVILSSVPRTGY